MTSPLRKTYYDSNQAETERKDVVISQLRAEAFELRQYERDYTDVSSRLNNLNHRFNLLQDEKAMDAKEHNARYEQAQRTIANLKDDYNALAKELSAIQADVQDARNDNQNINILVSTRTAEIAKLKNNLSDLFADNNDLTLQKKDLERNVQKLQVENREQTEENERTNFKIEEANGRKEKNERLVKELENDVDKCIKLNDDLKNQLAQLKAEIRDKVNLIKNAEQGVSENRKRIISLESRINDGKRVNEKLKADIATGKAEEERENNKAAQSTDKIRSLEDNIGVKDGEIDELKRQVDDLRRVQRQLLEENDALSSDIKLSNRHLDVVSAQHYELIDEVERCNAEDEEIRRVLNRKDRINNVRNRCQEKLRISGNKLSSSMQSPVKTASTNDRETGRLVESDLQ